MEFLQHILESSPYAFVSAIILGLMTAISPCPLATNIAAIGFISRDVERPSRVFFHGMIYTLGRAVSYVVVALLLYLIGDRLNISWFFQSWGEKLIGPILVIIGLFMLGLIPIRISFFNKFSDGIEQSHRGRYVNSLLLGMLFALSFCPYSAVLYFAILIPMSIASASGLYLPLVYAIGTGLPVMIFAWIIAFSFERTSEVFKNVKNFEYYVRRVISALFIIVGLYYIIVIYIKPLIFT